MWKPLKYALTLLFSVFAIGFAIVAWESGSLDYAEEQMRLLISPILKISVISTLTTLAGLVLARVFNKINKEVLKYKILSGFRAEVNSARIKLLMQEIIKQKKAYPHIKRSEISDKEYRDLSRELGGYTADFVERNYYIPEADRVKQAKRLHKMIMNVVETSRTRYRKAKVKIAKLKYEAERKRKKAAGEKVHKLFKRDIEITHDGQ